MRQQSTPVQATPLSHVCSADEELDLTCDWDPQRHGEGREGLRAYVEKELPHLLRAYDAEFLVDALARARGRRQS
ncbi:hypothetical protein GCM10028796_26990 [Ramlibacter monticola]|uniref:Uncharacterized protein n=1 Tax=Ramlibacter monticola TaxID=1926872 RepID=A0A937CVI1_9BURK|nr:hypothetical protein [Ramlibacter monticola]MBL0393753.1 hypothetical protein [Ramlibacter monticola]